MHMWQHVWRKSHAQMARAVPRFENGEEVLDDEEDHRGELATAAGGSRTHRFYGRADGFRRRRGDERRQAAALAATAHD